MRQAANIIRIAIGPAAALAVLLALAMTAIPARGQSGATAGIDSLLAIAMRDNETIRSAESAWAAAREKVPQAGALPDPMLLYRAEGMPLWKADPSQAAMNRLEVSQMIPFPGKQGAMKSAMAAEAGMAGADLTRVRLEVAAELRRAYADLLLLRERIDLMTRNQSTLRDFAAVARTKYEVGTAMQQDLLKANVELAQETSRIAVMQAMVPAAVARLNAILNRPADAPLPMPVRPDTTAIGTILDRGFDVFRGKVLSGQPMLAMKERAIERARSNLRLARKAGLPDFTVGIEYMGQREMPDEWMGMLGMTLPVWRGGKVAPARREAEASLRSAESDRNQARNDATSMAQEAWSAAAAARTVVNLYRNSVLPQAEQSLASTRAAYGTNRVDFLNVLDAQRMLLDAQLEAAGAMADYLKAQADLGVAAGDGDILGIGGGAPSRMGVSR